jgi:hypothetical protein
MDKRADETIAATMMNLRVSFVARDISKGGKAVLKIAQIKRIIN